MKQKTYWYHIPERLLAVCIDGTVFRIVRSPLPKGHCYNGMPEIEGLLDSSVSDSALEGSLLNHHDRSK